MEHPPPARRQHEPAEPPVLVVQQPRPPVVARRQRDRHFAAQRERAPVVQLVYPLEAEVVHEVAHAEGHHDGLVRRDGAQRAAVEMVEMRVRDEHEVDHGQRL